MDSLALHKDLISKLYLDENRTLNYVMSYVEKEHGIVASRGVYQRAFTNWNLRKNKPGRTWVWVDRGIQKRTEMGKKSNVVIRGTPWATSAVNKEISRHVTTVDRAQAEVATPETPDGYAIVTPAASSIHQQSPRATPSLETELVSSESEAKDRDLLAKLMEDCGSFVSAWARMGHSVRREDLISSYTAIAERLVTPRRDQELYSKTHHFLPDIVFHILYSAYKNLSAGLQTQLDQLARDLSPDTVRTAMFVAAAKGCTEVARTLLSLDVKVDSRDAKGQTCLHIAALHNHIGMVSYLISQKANVNQRRKDGQTVWTLVCVLETHEQISNLLIQAGADKHASVGGMNSLYVAASGGHTTSVRLLLRQGVNPSIKTAYGWAPLHWSAAGGYFEIVKLLVEDGADVNCVSDTGMTPLALMGNKWPEIKEYLQLHGALVKSPSPRKRASRKPTPRKPVGSRSPQIYVPSRKRVSTVDSSRNVAISPQISNRGISQTPSVGTSLANETFETIFGENLVETAIMFQSPIIPNKDLSPASSNRLQLESSYASQMPPPQW